MLPVKACGLHVSLHVASLKALKGFIEQCGGHMQHYVCLCTCCVSLKALDNFWTAGFWISAFAEECPSPHHSTPFSESGRYYRSATIARGHIVSLRNNLLFDTDRIVYGARSLLWSHVHPSVCPIIQQLLWYVAAECPHRQNISIKSSGH